MKPTDLAMDLYEQGLAAFREGNQATSKRLNEEALDVARANADRVNEVRALIGLSRVAFREGDHARLRKLCDEAMPIWEALPDRSTVTSPIHMRAESARMESEFERARELYEQSIAASHASGDEGMVALELNNMALLELTAQQPARALELSRESLAMTKDDLDRSYCFLACGAALVEIGDPALGVRILSLSKKLLDQEGVILDPADQPVFDTAVDKARQVLGYSQFDTEWAMGEKLSTEEIRSTII